MSKSTRSWLIAIILLSVLLRAGVAFYLGDSIQETRGGTYDQISYDMLAERVATGYGFSFAVDSWPYAKAGDPTAFWSYLYTLFLTGVYALAGHHPLVARLVQAVAAGILTPWLTYRIGRRAFGEQAGIIAAAIAAIYLYFAHYAASLMSETFYITGILWTVDLTLELSQVLSQPTTTRRFLGLGALLGLAMGATLLLRQVVIIFYPLLVLWLLWHGWRRGQMKQLLMALLAAALVAGTILAPFVIRNYRVFGRISMPNTNAGFAFFWGNHPIYETRFEPVLSPSHGVSYQELIPPELRDLNEAALDRALLARGLEFVRDDPGRYLLLSLSRIPVYFQFWPTSESTLLSNASRVLSFGVFLPFMIYGLILSIRHLRRGGPLRSTAKDTLVWPDLHPTHVVLFLLFIASYTAVHLASWANVRYRLPVDAFLILFAGYGLWDLAQRAGRRLAGAYAHGETVGIQ